MSLSQIDWLLLFFALVGALSLILFDQVLAAAVIIILMAGAIVVDRHMPRHPRRPAL
ncbi:MULTISPECIES: hypothetical protein [Lacticaseibacillus]|uniref:Uncharacterized protein n=4 Tax=Lacticaseibacillus TaxID=2759736 RepID=A0ABY9L3J8_9LACO|nr:MULTISPECIES: hypothetical protein [Lacticaseibacillus]MBI6598603.1 hypothetical protein [Lacticaseibacillus casei]MBO1482274.1 hypothetical protein [Lacticaseibacillus casei]MBO2417553.1 hypothetical protein [Lacticaseibacillus casei]MCK2081929.1 hypothetical protein [Lacticaseibacillus casei]MDE3281294.1 hypothetical protein [Lacticaseibacillus casei]